MKKGIDSVSASQSLGEATVTCIEAIMRNFFLSAVIVTSLMINSSQSNRRLGIVGGRQSAIDKTPYQAAFCANGKLKCGACIIDERWALTAGMHEHVISQGHEG